MLPQRKLRPRLRCEAAAASPEERRLGIACHHAGQLCAAGCGGPSRRRELGACDCWHSKTGGALPVLRGGPCVSCWSNHGRQQGRLRPCVASTTRNETSADYWGFMLAQNEGTGLYAYKLL